MRSTLKFLTSDDERLLLERADVQRFTRDERILEEGSHRAALFFIESGAARVERVHFGRGVSFARLGPGDRCPPAVAADLRGAGDRRPVHGGWRAHPQLRDQR